MPADDHHGAGDDRAPTGAATTAGRRDHRALASASSAASTLVITGHGWGHGIGMSQWGAYGYAQHGWSYRQILAHYYPGTTIGSRPSPTVRVLLVDVSAASRSSRDRRGRSSTARYEG